MSNFTTRGENKRLKAALWYAKNGFHVFPCHGILHVDREGASVPICSCGDSACERPGKHPATPQGLKNATIDPAQIKRWWKAHPEWNVAIACEPSELVLIDIDPRHGGDATWEQLKTELNINDDTAQAISGSGGPHLYYRSPAGVRVRSRNGALGPGIDVKSAGGYVIAPPSRHFSGGEYIWQVGHKITETAIAELPVALLERLQSRDGARASEDAARQTRATHPPNVEELRAALAFIDPIPRDIWLEIGMALHHGFDGSGDGFELWSE